MKKPRGVWITGISAQVLFTFSANMPLKRQCHHNHSHVLTVGKLISHNDAISITLYIMLLQAIMSRLLLSHHLPSNSSLVHPALE